jgi:hypothetical protein
MNGPVRVLLIVAILVSVAVGIAALRQGEALPHAAQSKSRMPFDPRVACGAEWGSSSVADATEPYEDTDAYDVYSAIIASIAPDPEMHMWLIGIDTLPISLSDKDQLGNDERRKEVKRAKGTALSDYVKVNSKRWILQRKFNLPEPYELVTEDRMRILFPDNGLFRGTWIQFSAVGFNPDKTMALVFLWDWCSIYCCCGQSSSAVLQKQSNGKWKVIGGAECAVS